MTLSKGALDGKLSAACLLSDAPFPAGRSALSGSSLVSWMHMRECKKYFKKNPGRSVTLKSLDINNPLKKS